MERKEIKPHLFMLREHPSVAEWISQGSLYDAAACPEDEERVSAALSFHRLLEDPLSPGGSHWIARQGRFALSLEHRTVCQHSPLGPREFARIREESGGDEVVYAFLFDLAEAEQARRATRRALIHYEPLLPWAAPPPLRLPSLAHPLGGPCVTPTRSRHAHFPSPPFDVNPPWRGGARRDRDAPPRFRGFEPWLDAARELPAAFEPALTLRRDAAGQRFEDFREGARAAAAQELARLGVTEADLAPLPLGIVEAALSAASADPSGRVLQKLRGKPSVLIAIALSIGDLPERWAQRGVILAPPLEAIRAGAKDRDVLALLEPCDPLQAEEAQPRHPAHDFARTLLERPISLHLAASLWEHGVDPALIPRDARRRARWAVVQSAVRQSRVLKDPAAVRYAARYGALLHGIAEDPRRILRHLKLFAALAPDDLALGRVPPKQLLRALSSLSFSAPPGVPHEFEAEGLHFRWMPTLGAVRELGRRFQNCLANLDCLDAEEAIAGKSAYFEVTWAEGRAAAQLSHPRSLMRGAEACDEPLEITALGPENDPLPDEITQKIQDALRGLSGREVVERCSRRPRPRGEAIVIPRPRGEAIGMPGLSGREAVESVAEAGLKGAADAQGAPPPPAEGEAPPRGSARAPS